MAALLAAVILTVLVLVIMPQRAYAADGEEPTWSGATPELQSVSAVSGQSVTVTWGKVALSSGYQVYRKTTGGWVKIAVVAGASTTSYCDATVASGETYKYTICAWKTTEANKSGYDAKGLTITYSNAGTEWAGGVPQLKSIASEETGVRLTWSKVNYASGYQIWRRAYDGASATYSPWIMAGFVSLASSLAYTDTNVSNAGMYQYTVCSYKTYAANRGQRDANGIKIRYLATPDLVSLENRPNGPVIEWGLVEGATGYTVYRKTAGRSWQELATIGSYTKLRYVDMAVEQGATVAYAVAATNYNTTIPNSGQGGHSAAGLSIVVNKGVAPATYTIQTTSVPCDPSFALRPSYNEKTRHYYLLRSYFERFEEEGGGVLVLSAGAYTITNALFIPSNTTVRLSNDVAIEKSNDTGSFSVEGSHSIFHLCAPSVAKASDAFAKGEFSDGYTEYNGVHDVNIIGFGTATIDLKGLTGQIPIIMAHTANVTISGITFQNVVSSHFIELDASYNTLIENCIFRNATSSGSSYPEAINLDTPDLNTGGFNSKWTSFDGTANQELTIEGCTFDSVPRAIGTHRYTYGKQHTDVKVINNVMRDIGSYAIVAMNWKDVTIQGNTIEHLMRGGSVAAILGQGTVNITLEDNVFNDMDRVARFCSWQSSGYGVINPSISATNKLSFTDGGNVYTNIGLAQINIYTGWDSAANGPSWSNLEGIPIVVN
jgi:hypothetical protein